MVAYLDELVNLREMCMKHKTNHESMTLWASVVTPFRYHHLGDVVHQIEELNIDVLHRQVGNIIGDLRRRGETQLIDELSDAIASLNDEIVKPARRLHESLAELKSRLNDSRHRGLAAYIRESYQEDHLVEMLEESDWNASATFYNLVDEWQQWKRGER